MGLLVQVIGNGTSDGRPVESGAGLSALLAGLPGLMEGQAAPDEGDDLQELIDRLMEQLGALDPNAELPQGLREPLAELLQLAQTLAASPTAGESAGQAVEAEGDLDAVAAWNEASSRTADQEIADKLQQTLAKIGEKLSDGETFRSQAERLAEPLRQALAALQGDAGRKAPESGGNNRVEPVVVPAHRAAKNEPSSSVRAESAEPNPASGDAQAEVRRVATLFRNPAWSAIGEKASAEPEDSEAIAAQAEPLPSGIPGTNGQVPVWMLRSEAAASPASGAANASAPASVPVRQFAEEMGKYLVKQFTLTHGNGVAEATIRLHPEHLGQVDIKLHIQNGQLTAHFVTENGAARELLENQMSQLRSALLSQGLQVDKLDVTQQSSQTAAAAFFQQPHGRQGSGRQGGGAKHRSAGGGYEDAAGFEAELDRTTFLREIGYGASLNVTA